MLIPALFYLFQIKEAATASATMWGCMARDLFESFFYYAMEQAVSGRDPQQQAPGSHNPGYGNEGGGGEGFFHRGGWGNLGRVFSSFIEAIPFGGGAKRKSVEVPESVDISTTGVEFGDHIEMAHFGHVELFVKGHDFVLQQLSNPTWCDECGDFIWGLYKHCLRCKCKWYIFLNFALLFCQCVNWTVSQYCLHI